MIEKNQSSADAPHAARIRKLDPHVANKIAAGEVVERPASVVKELVENALDAHARRIEIEVEEGGRRLIRVVDDGWGMGPEDLALAFAPHATSKLGDVEDLESIATLGFRGEALASIGSIAQTKITSRLADRDAGHVIENRGGQMVAPRAAATAPGTSMEVRHLFFNTPARAKFMRTERTELGHIESLVRKFALAFPEVGFVLSHNGRDLLRAGVGETRRERLAALYGTELAQSLVHTQQAVDGCAIEAYLAPPSVTRPHTRDMLFFVNGRAVQDRILHRLVKDVYRDTLHGGRHPVVFLFLDVDPARIDVNVHPTKSEVRWRVPGMLHKVVGPVLRSALRRANFAQEVSTEIDGFVRGASLSRDGVAATRWPERPLLERRLDGVRQATGDFTGKLPGNLPGRLTAGSHLGESDARHGGPGGESAGADCGGGPTPFSVFQIHDSYLVCEVEDGMAIVDQHALHERVQYDRLLKRLTAGSVETQRLLVPEQVEMDEAAVALLNERQALLARCGFEASPFGPRSVALEAVPVVLRRDQAAEVLRDLVELFRTHGAPPEAAADATQRQTDPSKIRASETSAPDDSASNDRALEGAVLESAVLEGAVMGDAALGDAVPGDDVPGDDVPGDDVLGDAVLGDIGARTLFHEVADTMACKAAIRFGDRISREEARALLVESGALDRAFVCPHGRPTVIRIGFAELEKRFGRR